jgi:hypothetical protein
MMPVLTDANTTTRGVAMYGALIQAVCGVVLMLTGCVVVGSVILAGAGVTVAMSGTDDDGDE